MTSEAYVPKRYESLENPFAHKPRKRSHQGSGLCGCLRKENKVYSDVVIVVKADNQNEDIGLDYLDNEVGIMYLGSQLSSGQIPPFLQPGKNTTKVNVELKGENEFGEKGKIPLLITVKLPIRLVIKDLIHLRKVVVNVNCSVVIDKLEANKSPKILDKVFTYGIDF
uniref:Late embryogenesis abundant protein LEA-2 subgroup domain-containing protein n=1 Tax=Glycine max TaxID=3847 RepID=A0A0R0HK67_SOYBN